MAKELPQGVVEIIDPETGNTSLYKKVSACLNEFLAKYPVSEGYGLQFKAHDANGAELGTVRHLYEQAIAQGRKPGEYALPEMSGVANVVHTAWLVHKGERIACASALKPVRKYKDWERGQTAALGRLLRILGFGSLDLDEDESGDMDDQGLEHHQPTPSLPPPFVIHKDGDKRAELAATSAVETAPADATGDIPVHMLKQLAHVAAQRGVTAPAVHSRKDCAAQIKALMARPIAEIA